MNTPTARDSYSGSRGRFCLALTQFRFPKAECVAGAYADFDYISYIFTFKGSYWPPLNVKTVYYGQIKLISEGAHASLKNITAFLQYLKKQIQGWIKKGYVQRRGNDGQWYIFAAPSV